MRRVVHASALIDFGGATILTDPWLSERPGYLQGEPRSVPSAAQLPALAECSATRWMVMAATGWVGMGWEGCRPWPGWWPWAVVGGGGVVVGMGFSRR